VPWYQSTDKDAQWPEWPDFKVQMCSPLYCADENVLEMYVVFWLRAPALNHIILLCLLFGHLGSVLGAECTLFNTCIYLHIYTIYIYIYICSFIFKGMLTPVPLWNHQKVQLYAALLNVSSFVLKAELFGAPFFECKKRAIFDIYRFPRCSLLTHEVYPKFKKASLFASGKMVVSWQTIRLPIGSLL